MSDRDLPERPRFEGHLVLRDVDDEMAIYDSKAGEFHFINPTGSVIFSLCDGAHTIDDIADEISNTFDKTPSNVKTEIYEFLNSLSEKGLLVRES